jgi:hypothetical protein
MSWIIFCILSAVALALGVVLSVLIVTKRIKNSKLSNAFNALAVGVSVSMFLLALPAHFYSFKGEYLPVLKTVLLSLNSVMKLFVVDFSYGEFMDSVLTETVWVKTTYSVLTALLCVTGPALTFGVILSLFKNLSARLKYYLSYFKDVYIFSELNKKSIALATDLKKKHPNAVVVFTDVFENEEEQSFELIEEAKTLGGICFKNDILSLNFKRHSKSRQIYFFTIGENETENVEQSLTLIEKYGDMPNTHLYVFSTRLESELLLTNVKKSGMKVRRINQARSLIYRLLYENGVELFKNEAVQTDEQGTKVISTVVVGLGRHGTEIVKALAWFCQFPGYRVEINAYDQDPLAEDKFQALCPELMSKDYNGVYKDGESQYKITVHSGVNVDSLSFIEKIKELDGVSYAFVSLGKDDENVKAAVNLRTAFEQKKIKPRIQAIVYNTGAKQILDKAQNHAEQPYKIECIGDLETYFSESVILNSELETKALKRHLKYNNDETVFWAFEYNYRSSTASAIHMKLRKDLGIAGGDKDEKDLTEEEAAAIEPIEHVRWNAYMRTEGFIYSGDKGKASRNDLAKMHNNLHVFAELSDEDKRKDRQQVAD